MQCAGNTRCPRRPRIPQVDSGLLDLPRPGCCGSSEIACFGGGKQQRTLCDYFARLPAWLPLYDIDHVWLSPGLKGALKSQTILKKMRGWQKASDHVPVIVDLSL